MREIVTIWLKELRDTIRDRRTLLVMVLVPVLVTPALIAGLQRLAQSNANKPVHVAVQGAGDAPALMRYLRAQPRVAVESSGNPAAAVKGGKADAGVVIASDFAARVAAGGAGNVTVYQDSTQLNSSRAVSAVTAAVAQYRAGVVARRLHARGVAPSLLNPVLVATPDVATKQERAGFVLSLIVPMFLVIYSMVGGMYTAMDLSAGEKERSTLEALLLSPATKLQITLGKLLAVSSVAVCTIVLAMGSLFVALQRSAMSPGGTSIGVSLPAGMIALVALLGVLLALSFSALELALGIFARSFKEAQSYITPLYLLAVLPTVALSSIPGLKPGAIFYAIPALNAVLVFKDALLGALNGSAAVIHVALTIASMLLFCVLCIAVTLRIFSDERVLLRT